MRPHHGQRPERAVLELPLGKHALQLERRSRIATKSHEQADRLVPKPPECDLEHASRRGIEPLDVVQRDHHRPAVGQSPQRIEHGQPNGMCVWTLVARLREQQRDSERPPARRGKQRREIVKEWAEQVRQPSKRERCLGFRTPVCEDMVAALRGQSHAPFPENGLPNPRLPARTRACGPLSTRSRKSATAASSCSRPTTSPTIATLYAEQLQRERAPPTRQRWRSWTAAGRRDPRASRSATATNSLWRRRGRTAHRCGSLQPTIGAKRSQIPTVRDRAAGPHVRRHKTAPPSRATRRLARNLRGGALLCLNDRQPTRRQI